VQLKTAATRLMLLLAAACSASLVCLDLILGTSVALLLAAPLVLCPVVARELVLGYPSRTAKRMAEDLLRSSVGAVNVMVMSLRHEPSMPAAMVAASKGGGEFPREVERGLWEVIMGRFASFEEAMMDIGSRWGHASEQLKTALNSMVTACREATDEGRRRALDRANRAVISGARQKIEEYALSLSMPSMLMFGLGILLPLMVGSFLPMLSWDIWSTDGLEMSPPSAASTSPEMVLVMNVLFPGVAAFVAMNAVSGHPLGLQAGRGGETRTRQLVTGTVIGLASAICSGLVLAVTGVRHAPMLALLAGVLPIAVWMASSGAKAERAGSHAGRHMDDLLFRTGARMLDGENFEWSLRGVAADAGEGLTDHAKGLLGRLVLSPYNGGPLRLDAAENELEGIRIAREAAAKDELGAGTLAMDVATYVKDLRELETSLKARLKPTISMMRTTALLLAPVVLGVTYAIYVTLGSMMHGLGFEQSADVFFIVLGVFLAEMGAVVVYFVWGISGGTGSLARQVGTLLAVSELAYVATALVSSGV